MQLVAEILWPHTAAAAAKDAAFDTAYTGITLDDMENGIGAASVGSQEFVDQSWAYYVDAFGRPPAHVGDLLLGIAMGRDGLLWWVPTTHPIARILVGNTIGPITRHSALLCYERADLVLAQRSLAALLVDKALREEGMLHEDDDGDMDDDGGE